MRPDLSIPGHKNSMKSPGDMMCLWNINTHKVAIYQNMWPWYLTLTLAGDLYPDKRKDVTTRKYTHEIWQLLNLSGYPSAHQINSFALPNKHQPSILYLPYQRRKAHWHQLSSADSPFFLNLEDATKFAGRKMVVTTSQATTKFGKNGIS